MVFPTEFLIQNIYEILKFLYPICGLKYIPYDISILNPEVKIVTAEN